jgi:acyl-CoA synthetase (AMP-forming)/AMP-acid ligase II
VHKGALVIGACAAIGVSKPGAIEYPREVAFIAEMPMTTTGKVIRRLLRRQAGSKRDRGVIVGSGCCHNKEQILIGA